MPHYNIVIETHREGDGRYRVEVVEGPEWAKRIGYTRGHKTALVAVEVAKAIITGDRRRGLRDTFDFIHAEG